MKPINFDKDTTAWIFQVWASFIISMGAMGLSLAWLPMDNWMKGQLGVSFLFSISSSFTLAKTLRDNQEAHKLTSRIDEARVEKLLAEHNSLK
ncbi:hypothetical protein BST81_12785 [Leptolyngbya sp. 'hensonii']|nr:hypothetical protein BST81_12785 [Leptolyngbya sp. 'hensonii']